MSRLAGTLITLIAALAAVMPTTARAQSCSLCISFATTYDVDGPGGVPAKTRLHPDLTANVPYVLDVDTDLPPLPAGTLPILPPYDVRVNVSALDATKPRLTIERLPAAPLPASPLPLPLRIELVRASGPTWASIGYDALASSAPQKFTADLDLSDRDGDPLTDQARLDATITGAAKQLTLVSETFGGDPAGTRTDRHVTRLTYGGKHVPTRITADVTTAANRQHVVLTRDAASPTTLGFEVSKPGSATTGTVDTLPQTVDVTLAGDTIGVDTDRDRVPDFTAAKRTIDYTGATSVAHRVVVDTTSGDDTTHAEVTDLPTDAHLTYSSPIDHADPDGQTQVTYHANGRAARAQIDSQSVRADGIDRLAADVLDVPKTITQLTRKNVFRLVKSNVIGTQIVYDADTPAASLTIDNESRTGGALKGTHARVIDLPSDVTLTQTALTGENHIDYRSQGGATRADVEIVDDAATRVEDENDRVLTLALESERAHNRTAPPLPQSLSFDAVKAGDDLHVDYAADAAIAKATINGKNLKGLPERVHNLNLELGAIPTRLGFDTHKSRVETVHTELNCPRKTANCDPDDLPDCDFDHPPVSDECERMPTKTTKRVTTDTNVAVEAPSGRLGSAAVQLTNRAGVDAERLPATAHARPQDGALVRDFESKLNDRYLVDIRASAIAGALIEQRAFTNSVRNDQGEALSGFAWAKMHLRLDALARPDRALGLDMRKRAERATAIQDTDVLLAGQPGLIDLDTLSSSGLGNKTEVHWRAPVAVPGFCEGSGGPSCAPDEQMVPGFSYRAATEDAEGTHVGKTLSLYPMPERLDVCKIDDEPTCVAPIFDHNIERLAHGDSDSHDCFPGGCVDVDMPISPARATKGSTLIEASRPVAFLYGSGTTVVNFAPVTRFALQADQVEYDCAAGLATCKKAYLALDTDGHPLQGDLYANNTVHLRFPAGFSAGQHVWSAWKNTPTSGYVASAGPITCPDGTIIDTGEKDLYEQVCRGDVFGEGDLLDIDL